MSWEILTIIYRFKYLKQNKSWQTWSYTLICLLEKLILVNKYPDFDFFAITASKQQAYIDMLKKIIAKLKI